MNSVIRAFVKVTLENTEDFIDLIENPRWIQFLSIFYFHLSLVAFSLILHKKDIQLTLQDGYFKNILDIIRYSFWSEGVVEAQNSSLNAFFSVISLIVLQTPLFKVLASILFKRFKPQLNRGMVRFFTAYAWFLFIPCTYFHANMIHVSNFKNAIDIFNLFCGYWGLVVVIIDAILVNYIFRNHQFRDKNLVRKKNSQTQYINIILMFILVILNGAQTDKKITVIMYHVYMLLLFFDYFNTFPFPDPKLSQFYFQLICLAEINAFLFTLMSDSSLNNPTPYSILCIQISCLVWILSGRIQQNYFVNIVIMLQDSVDERFLKFSTLQLIREENQIRQYLAKRASERIDVYIEYISQLADGSVRSQQDKMKLIKLIIHHRKNCINLSCHCHNKEFYLFLHQRTNLEGKSIQMKFETQTKKQSRKQIDDDQSVNHPNINKFLNVVFRETLKLQRKSLSDQILENLTLKHVSFITRVQDNPPQAYYDLKILIKEVRNCSLHFKVMSQVISKAVQNQILKKQLIYIATEAVEEGNVNIQHEQNQQLITLENMLEQLNYQELISGEIRGIIQLKIHFWTNFLNGDMNNFQVIQNKLITAINKLNLIMIEYEKVLILSHSKNIISARVTQLYHMIVSRDIREIKSLEHSFSEMIRKDKSMPEELLTSLRVLENEVEILITSVLKDKGRILNRKTPRMAAFFNYDYEGFKEVHNVKQLMPQYLAQIHNDLMDNYLRRGYSRIIKASDRDVFIKDYQGFIRPVKLNLENFFAFEDDFNLIASLMQLNQNKQYIIFDVTGKIQGSSKQLYKSIKEKSDFIHQKNAHFQKLSNLGTLTKEQFFNELFIFMILPDVVIKIKEFLQSIRLKMEQDGYEDFDEQSIMKYLIQENQKQVDIARFHKCELFVPANLQLIIDGYKTIQQQFNPEQSYVESKMGSSMLGTNKTMSQRELRRYEKQQSKSEFIKGLSIFNQKSLQMIEEYMSQHRMIYIFQGGCFKYYMKMNLQFVLLAQQKYTSRNMAFFVLNIVEKKIAKKMLKNLIINRLIQKEEKNQQENLKEKEMEQERVKENEDLVQKPNTIQTEQKDEKKAKKISFFEKKLAGRFADQKQETAIANTVRQTPLKEQKIKRQNTNWVYSMLRSCEQNFDPIVEKNEKGDLEQEIVEFKKELDSEGSFRPDKEQQTDKQQTFRLQTFKSTFVKSVSIQPKKKKNKFWSGIAKKLRATRQVEPQLVKKKSKEKMDLLFEREEDSNSDNQFDEDLTEKSSQLEDGGGFFQVQGQNRNKQDDGNQSTQSSKPESVLVGSQIVKKIFSSQSLTKGEKMFILFNIILAIMFIAFYFGLIAVILLYREHLGIYLDTSNLIQSIGIHYERIVGQYSIMESSFNINDQQHQIFWQNQSYSLLNFYGQDFTQLINQENDKILLFNDMNDNTQFLTQLLNPITQIPYNQTFSFLSFLQMVSTELGSLNTSEFRQNSALFLLQNNYFYTFSLMINNQDANIQDFQEDQNILEKNYFIIYIIILIILVIITIFSIYANNRYNSYLKFLLLAITRIKVEEVDTEIRRLQNFLRILTDSLTPWISQDLYQLYFNNIDQETLLSKTKDDLRNQRDKMNHLNQKFNQKSRQNYQMLQYFMIINIILFGFTLIGLFTMINFSKNQKTQLNVLENCYDLDMSLSSFVTRFNLMMAQDGLDSDSPLKYPAWRFERLEEQVEKSRNTVNANVQNALQISNPVFQKYYRSNICNLVNSDEIDDQNLSNVLIQQCENSFSGAHLSSSINQIISGMINIRMQGDIKYMVSNQEVQFFLWDYYQITSPYIQYITQQVVKDINDSTDTQKRNIVIYNIFGLSISLFIIYIAYVFGKFFKTQRKGAQLLLSLIPHEKLSLDITINLLKQLQKL